MALSARQVARSVMSLALAASTVCHCMLAGSSAPPAHSGSMWSAIQPGQGPRASPVDGQGLRRLKATTVAARPGAGCKPRRADVHRRSDLCGVFRAASGVRVLKLRDQTLRDTSKLRKLVLLEAAQLADIFEAFAVFHIDQSIGRLIACQNSGLIKKA